VYTKKHEALLTKTIESILKKAQKDILDNTECAVEGKDRWSAVRSRILGATNTALRELKKEIQRNWEVKYTPLVVHEDVIEVKQPVKERDKKNGYWIKET